MQTPLRLFVSYSLVPYCHQNLLIRDEKPFVPIALKRFVEKIYRIRIRLIIKESEEANGHYDELESKDVASSENFESGRAM